MLHAPGSSEPSFSAAGCWALVSTTVVRLARPRFARFSSYCTWLKIKAIRLRSGQKYTRDEKGLASKFVLICMLAIIDPWTFEQNKVSKNKAQVLKKFCITWVIFRRLVATAFPFFDRAFDGGRLDSKVLTTAVASTHLILILQYSSVFFKTWSNQLYELGDSTESINRTIKALPTITS